MSTEADSEKQFWYNSRTGEVEVGPQSIAVDRIGPFSTADEAARAPEILAARAKAWADSDAAEDR
ncbi:MAG: SPOR domain-containing protein [Microbacterium sp.]